MISKNTQIFYVILFQKKKKFYGKRCAFSFKEWLRHRDNLSSDSFYLARPTISHVFSIYHRTAIDLRVAIYELERALHDRRRVNIIFLRKEAWERPSIR